MTTLISLLSDQTLPNVLFIEAVKKDVDSYIFLDTERSKAERRMDTIIRACGIEHKTCTSILVDPEKYDKCLKALSDKEWIPQHRYLVNITGGTKMMALAAKSFFEQIEFCSIYYIPVGHKIAYCLSPNDEDIELPCVNLKQYLLAHAFTYEDEKELFKPHSMADKIFSDVMTMGHAAQVDSISKQIHRYHGQERNWYGGKWFEEWLYVKFRDILGLSTDDIALNVKLKHFYGDSRLESDGEFDILFVKNNKLFMVEAKVYTAHKLPGSKSIVPLYKIASQKSTLGLHAEAIVIILAPIWHIKSRKNRIKDLMRLLKIKHVWDLEDMKIYKERIGRIV